MVDGGAPQVNAAGAVLRELGIGDIAVCGLAKRLEEVWQPDEAFPVILPRTSEGLYLLQRVRDEAHRFAITFHRERRSKRMTASVLDDVAGLGEVRRKALLRHVRLAEASSAAATRGGDPRGARASAAGPRRRSWRRSTRPPRTTTTAGRRRRQTDRRRTPPTDESPDTGPNRSRRRHVTYSSVPRRGGGGWARRRPRVTSERRRASPCDGHGRGPVAVEPPVLRRSDTDLVIVTGVSGGGRSTVARALENVGYYVVDNLPQALMLDMAELAYQAGGAAKHTAMVLDVRSRAFSTDLAGAVAGAAGARLLAPGAVRRRRRRGADPPVRERAPVAPAAGATAGSPTASRPSASCWPRPGRRPTWSSTPATST